MTFFQTKKINYHIELANHILILFNLFLESEIESIQYQRPVEIQSEYENDADSQIH
jgi:hypothetical protein